MDKHFTYSLKASLLILFIAATGYILFEYNSNQALTTEEVSFLIDESLDAAQDLFITTHDSFVRDSENLFSEISSLQFPVQSVNALNNRLSAYSFWGSALYSENQRIGWNGYNITPLSVIGEPGPLRVSLLKRSNVVYFFGQQSFNANGETYHLLTSQLLELKSNLSFSDQVDVKLSDNPKLKDNYPVQFSFFDPVPEDAIYRKLSTEFSDSLGVVYALQEDTDHFLATRNDRDSSWRFLLQLLLLFTLLMVLITWFKNSVSVLIRLIQFTIILALWLLVYQSGLVSHWANFIYSSLDDGSILHSITFISYIINATFLWLIVIFTLQSIRTSNTVTAEQSYFRTLLFSVLFGVLGVFMILFFIHSTQGLLLDGNFKLLDLELLPDTLSFLFYLSTFLFFTAIGGIIISAAYYLFLVEKDKSVLITVYALAGFLTSYFLVDLFFLDDSIFNWIFLLSLTLFSTLILLAHGIYKYSFIFYEMSGFRKLMIAVLLSSMSVYFILWNSTSKQTDRELVERVQLFVEEETESSEVILSTILNELERRLLFLSESDLTDRTQIVQGQFQRAIQNSIRQSWRDYSFEIQLLDTDGNIISDYSTNLDSPGWRSLVDIRLMASSYRGEQIRRETNQPVIWDRPNTLGENFISFNRGWIPIYDEIRPNTIIAWIFGAVYLERPDYNKPMRAVLSAATSEDWGQSFYLAEFASNRVVRSAVQGIYNNQPEYNRLPAREAEIAERDSIAFITNITNQGSFREVLLKHGDRRVIKASTPIPGFNHHLFSFFRMLIINVYFGLFVFAILSMTGRDLFSLFGQSRKFKHRLLDGLTLATILFLTGLIIVTQIAVGYQNEKNVERDLIIKLNSLSESLRSDIDNLGSPDYYSRLNEFAGAINVDAILYAGPNVIDSTTPQIFQEHLMPRSMPYTVYDFLYNRQRRHFISEAKIGNEELLIGYRALLNSSNEPIATIAIPTFVQSPVYREQLLNTTSYLFGVYLAIFGLFIIGTVLFSNQLTKPLRIIQAGLTKITRGGSQNMVDVTSDDEIGSLAKAYNEMVQRLDVAQKELISAEREAAWKEMAQQVAHEIKNPLTPMKLNLQHLQRQLKENPENVMVLKPIIERTAANIIEQIESLNKIASDFSKFAKPVQESRSPVNLNKLITSVADLYANNDSVEIRLHPSKKSIMVLGVEDELRRVLINLIKNGIEASTSQTAIIDVSLSISKNSAVMSISDYGKGISDADKERIFVPNFSTKSSGTGLGLAITKRIVIAHQGDIWFESSPERNTTFYVQLPLIS